MPVLLLYVTYIVYIIYSAVLCIGGYTTSTRVFLMSLWRDDAERRGDPSREHEKYRRTIVPVTLREIKRKQTGNEKGEINPSLFLDAS